MYHDYFLDHKNSRQIHKSYIKQAGKQMLQHRSELPSLFTPISWSSSSRHDSTISPQPAASNSKFNLKFIEKENRRPSPSKHSRARTMKSSQMPLMYKMQQSYPSGNVYMAKITPTNSNVIRTPSSGISSSSSSENMMSALSLSSDEEKRLRDELLDPSVEVDLEAFMLPSTHDTTLTQERYQHRSMHQLPTSVSQQQPQQQHQSQMYVPFARQQKVMHVPAQNQPPPQHYQQPITPMFHSQMAALNVGRPRDATSAHSVLHTPSSVHVKNQSDWTDYNSAWNSSNPSSSSTNGVGTSSSSSGFSQPAAQNSNGNRGCNYCWESYVKLCNRVANLDPVFPVDGPWNWHSLYDRQGKVSCPRLWFVQLDRAGAEMVEQLTRKRSAF